MWGCEYEYHTKGLTPSNLRFRAVAGGVFYRVFELKLNNLCNT
jgi:hypothetical protein